MMEVIAMAPLQRLHSNGLLLLLQGLLVAVFALNLVEATGTVGVNYGTLGTALPTPPQVAQLVLSTPLRAVKTYTPDPLILQSFANTNITLTVGIPTETIPSLAASSVAAQAWLQTNVAAFTPATKVTHLAVGNEVFTTAPHLIPQLVPAMTNLHAALVTLKLEGIKVGTPNNLQVLERSFPPSSGVFRGNITAEVKALMAFLNATGGPVMVNFYPYFAYRDDPQNVSLAFALFQGEVADVNTGLRYGSMLEAQLDAVHSAVERLGFRGLPVVVSETGWPSGGDEGAAATPANAQAYNANLMKYVASGKGTPLRPGVVVDAFIFALFNENLKPGSISERFFGLFNPDRTPAYNLNLTTTTTPPSPVLPPPINTAPLPPPTSPLPVPAPPANIYPPPTITPPTPPIITPPTPPIITPPTPVYTPPAPPITVPAAGGKTWCVAKAGAAEADVRSALGYACGDGGADCGAIQVGGACYNPDTLLSHASVAFNAYYQKAGRNYWNCYFGGTAVITITDPSYSECNFH